MQEVEIGTLARRVQGEQFQVASLDACANGEQSFANLISGAFRRHLATTEEKSEKVDAERKYGRFKVVPVLADGFCFWHCLLRSSLPAEYEPVHRSASGGPRLKNRLHVEIETAKTAVEEFIALLMASPSHDESIVKALQNSPQVEINHIQTICEVSGLALRVTLSEEAC